MIGFISTSVTSCPNHTQLLRYRYFVQFTVAHALGFSVFESLWNLLAISYSITLEPWNSTKNPVTNRLALCNRGTDKAENTVLLSRGADHTENTSNVIATQLVHWCADCSLPRSYNIHPLRHSFHFSSLERVYGAVAWQCIDQIHYNTVTCDYTYLLITYAHDS
jgi:hypothetical protein